MSCDVCNLRLPLSHYLVAKSVEATLDGEIEGADKGNAEHFVDSAIEGAGKAESESTGEHYGDSAIESANKDKVSITGHMPKDATANLSKINNDEAFNMAKKFKSDINQDEVIYAYDISLNSEDMEYQPAEYNTSVKVRLSNLDLDTSKTYALLHIIDDNNYEILPAKATTKSAIEFTARSFSTYIVISVDSHSVTFDGENYKVFDTYGNEITNRAIIAEGTGLTFVIMPDDEYGVTGITSSGASGVTTDGSVRSMTANIASVTEDLTIYVTTDILPDITTQPVPAKITAGEDVTYTIAATNATTYEWQYRESGEAGWKTADAIGSGYDIATFSMTDVTLDYSGYEIRCLVGNENFTGHERVSSDIAYLSVAQGETSLEVIQIRQNTITFEGENYTVIDVDGNKIESGITVGSGVDFVFTIMPDNKYGVTGVTCTMADGTNAIEETIGGIRSMTCRIPMMQEDLTIYVTVVGVPEITQQPVSQKVNSGDTATFTIVASDATSYEWQYRVANTEAWLSASEIGRGYDTDTLVISDTASASKGYEIRCIVRNDDFAEHEGVESDIAYLSVAQGDTSVDVNVTMPNYSVDGVYYQTLADAYEAISTTGTIKVEQDVTDESSFVVESSKTIVLDLNGKTLTKTGDSITNDGTLTISGDGTIIAETGVINNGTLTIGIDDGTISKAGPVIIGETYAVDTLNGTFNMYDGVLKGKVDAVSGDVTAKPTDYGVYKSTEEIDGVTYQTARLEKGWYIGNTEGTDDVWAFLLDNPDEEGMYILTIQGTGVTKAYGYGGSPWVSNSSKISKLIIENGITGIGDRTFYNLDEITSLTLPSTLKSIGANAFYTCSSLKGTVIIPKSVTSIGTGAFMKTPIEAINVEDGNANYMSSNGVLYTKDGTKLMIYPYGKTDTNYTVLEGTKEIAVYSFYEAKLKTVDLPSTLTTVSGYAFQNSAITSVVIPASVKSIGQGAFKTNSLQTVYLKSTSLNLFGNAFADLKSGSIIYTMSEAIVEKFIPGTIYTAANTSIYYPPVISTQPTAQSVIIGEQATFTVGVTLGNPTDVTYNWQYRENSEESWKDVTDAQGSINESGDFVTVATTEDMTGYQFRCVISNDAYPNAGMTIDELASSLVSNYATLNVQRDVSEDSTEITVTITNELREYDGTQHKPDVTVKYVEELLDLNTDYTVEYGENIDAGAGTIIVTGAGKYGGTRTIEFMINDRPITVKPEDMRKPYDGSDLISNNVAEVTAGSLVSGDSITITTSGSQKEMGSSYSSIESITITNETRGDVTDNYNITKAQGSLTVTSMAAKELTVEVIGSGFVYNGNAIMPGIVVYDGDDVVSSEYYDIVPSNNVNAGEATVSISGKELYDGSYGSAKFDIAKRPIAIIAGSDSKPYDGSKLECITYSVSGDLGSGDAVTATTEGSISVVGEASNVIATHGIFKGENEVTGNYDVTLVPGKLVITKANITGGSVKITGMNRVYKTLVAELDLAIEVDSATYRWYTTDGDIKSGSGTDADKLFVTEDLIGKQIFVEVTVSKEYYNDAVYRDSTDATNNDSATALEAFKPILKAETSVGYDNDIILGNEDIEQKRSDISKIVIKTDPFKPSGAIEEWDVSRDENGSVTAWIVQNGEDYELHIGAMGSVIASDVAYIFSGYTECASIEGLDTMDMSMIDDMSYMFADCSALTELDVSGFDTSSVSSMENMFAGCSGLTDLDVSGFDTIRVTNMKEMFSGCSSLVSLTQELEVANVQDMSGMFAGCSGLSTIDVSGFETASATNMASMFDGCSSVAQLDVKGFVTENVKSMGRMFAGCSALESLDLSNFNLKSLDGTTYFSDASGVKDINVNEMFSGCSGLRSLVLGRNFDRIDGTNMFSGCGALEAIIAQKATAMTLGDSNIGVADGTVLYVPNEDAEASYESAGNYAGVFGAGRVERMMEILGEDPEHVELGSTYVESGAKVAGFEMDEASEYEQYGYTLEIAPDTVKTDVTGTTKVVYTLKYFDTTVDRVDY